MHDVSMSRESDSLFRFSLEIVQRKMNKLFPAAASFIFKYLQEILRLRFLIHIQKRGNDLLKRVRFGLYAAETF